VIPINKLAKLSPRHRMRKCALVLQELERQFLTEPEAGEGALGSYSADIGKLISGLDEAPKAVQFAALSLAACGTSRGTELLRAVDALRHELLKATGQAPADWDLLDPRTGAPNLSARHVHQGMKVYLEDLRSPFNVGSIFRTADAFGLEELLLSPSCADPEHPRAQRSAMGSGRLLPWHRAELETLAGQGVFALELGGENIDSFSFPDKGIAILGSEELGISREARMLCTEGVVSIPMSGVKGSLNVAVAFGILMHAWTQSVCC
jgi:RNA methyltransferase, TrmH family